MKPEGIKGFAQKHRGEWTFTERQMKGDTHRALLVQLEEIKPCVHSKVYGRIGKKNENWYYGGSVGFSNGLVAFDAYECAECGVELESTGFVEVKK